MTDPIADMLTRIKNAHLACHSELTLPHSKIKAAIANILAAAGYIESMEIKDIQPQKAINIKLKYIGKTAAITNVKRLSRPGRRVYSPANKIPKTLGGYGLTIISTNQGVMTGKEAKKQNLGGELLCQVW